MSEETPKNETNRMWEQLKTFARGFMAAVVASRHQPGLNIPLSNGESMKKTTLNNLGYDMDENGNPVKNDE